MTIHASALDQVRWNDQGLIAAIAQDATSGEVLMMAWMNREALTATLEEGRAVYWSRSRQSLWRKGESSGNTQIVKELRLDCDKDTLLLRVQQKGGIACHTGRRHCFMHELEQGRWVVCEPVVKDPREMYSGPA